MKLVSTGIERFPDAHRDGLEVVASGEPQLVVPKDVVPHPVAKPLALDLTLHEIAVELREIVDEPTEDAAADRLLQYVRKHGWPELCRHGRGPWHPNGRSTGSVTPPANFSRPFDAAPRSTTTGASRCFRSERSPA